jgi:RNA 2',3'-cyclic 3'-phosphodiesterase
MSEAAPPGSALRLFIAVPATDAVREAAAAAIERLRGHGDVRWTSVANLHLTVKFLGDTPGGRVPQLRDVLAKKANKFYPFMVELGGAGAFPSPRKPQIVWLAVGEKKGETGLLAQLAGEVDRAVHPLGFDLERRPFRAHVTIGRVRSARGLSDLARLLQQPAGACPRLPAGETVRPVEWPVEGLHLVRSVLRPTGPEYTILHHFPLGREE